MSDCDHGGYSHKKGRVYCRAFSYAEARERWAAGETITALAAEYGVSWKGVKRALDSEFRKRFDAQSAAQTMSGTCPDCGKTGTYQRHGKSSRCRACAASIKRTSVRVNGSGEVVSIRCGTCKEWKDADQFSPSRRKLVRAGGKGARTCRACETKLRQEYRERHKVPCSRCGKPCLSASEKKRHDRPVTPTTLCRACWLEVEGPKRLGWRNEAA